MFTQRARLRSHGRIGRALLMAVLLTASAGAVAGPKAIEETARISPPDPAYQWPISYAVDGDWLITTGSRSLDSAGTVDSSVWVHRRQSNGAWTLVGRILQHVIDEDGDEPSMKVSADGGVAAILREHSSWIFERSGTSWVQVPSPIETDGMDVEVQGGTITVSDGHCTWESNSYRKGTNGAWQLVRHTPGVSGSECENEDNAAMSTSPARRTSSRQGRTEGRGRVRCGFSKDRSAPRRR